MNGQSTEDLLKFMDFLGDKGLMKPQTASSRKASAASLLSILSDEEAADVTKLDLEQITQRFLNLKGSAFKPESVKLYKARTESAIKDFIEYKRDPLSFKPSLSQRAARNSGQKPKSETAIVDGEPKQSHAPNSSMQTEGVVFPIPLRAGVTVKVAGIPADLKSIEARKISNVILALAMPD